MAYASVMRAQIDRLDAVAQNASNLNSVGYLQQNSTINPESFLNLLAGNEKKSHFDNNFNQSLGSLKITNTNTDIGLASPDWFVLDGLDKTYITRNGRFSLSKDGFLMLGEHRVIGLSGPIKGVTEGFEVRSNGAIYIGEQYLDTMKIVSLSEINQLTPIGNGIYSLTGDVIETENGKVVQGALVNANVDLESDMTKMIQITRHIEMLQRSMSAYGDMLDTGINQIGK